MKTITQRSLVVLVTLFAAGALLVPYQRCQAELRSTIQVTNLPMVVGSVTVQSTNGLNNLRLCRVVGLLRCRTECGESVCQHLRDCDG
ncbi:MAG: hypothetical protein WCO56_17910 [Verrucomicrobiota bacterium]